jgi:acyl-CoA synthetase (AMP-forming)/AMP-acid ligase II
MAQMMLEVPDHGSYDLSHLRCWMSASAPLRADLQERIRSELRIPADALANAYGITESLMNTFCLGKDLLKRPSSAGRPVPLTEVRILGQDREFLRPGEIGEIVISGPCQLRTYLGRQTDYVNVMLEAEGKRWYRSGDLGYFDQDGFLFIADRSKDMIITGGENVYSVEVEMALMGQPDVAEVAVIGQPDAKWGERVVAVIVPKKGRQPTESDLLHACIAIASYKRPKRFVFLESLPRNSFGKVQKSVLRDIVKSIP